MYRVYLTFVYSEGPQAPDEYNVSQLASSDALFVKFSQKVKVKALFRHTRFFLLPNY